MGRTSDAKERLMAAALDLMWEESYGAVSIDDICRRADVKKGSFYYFFESKSDLAIAALERMWEEQWKPTLDTHFSSSIDPLRRIHNYLAECHPNQSELKKKHGKVLGCPICSVGSEITTQDEKLGAKVREIFSRKKRYYESTIRDAMAEGLIEPCDPVVKANCLMGLIEGIISQARIMNDLEVLRQLPAMAFDLLKVKTDVSRPLVAST